MSKEKKTIWFIVLFLLMHTIYAGVVYYTRNLMSDDNKVPAITFDKDLIEIELQFDENGLVNKSALNEAMMKGVKAKDVEDGDITDNVFIHGISTFDQDKIRTITYGVFDSGDQLITATRQLKYTNYTEPKFKSNKSLINLTMTSTSDIYMNAVSSVDGDVTNKISMNTVEKNGIVVFTYSVTDSTGSLETLQVTEEINLLSLLNNIDIELTDYILYLKVGDEFNPRNYIKTVNTSLGSQTNLISQVMVETNCDTSIAGQYEAKYTINRENGDYGISKMIIIVE